MQDSADDEDDASKPDGHLATMLISDHASDDGANERTTGCERGDKLLLRGCELVPKRCANGDEDRGDVARVVTLMLLVWWSGVV